MRSKALIVFLFACLPLLGQPPAGKRPRDLPFLCVTQPWNGPFKVVSATYDRAGKRLVWILEAKKDTKAADYQALMNDADGVEQASVKVKLQPNSAMFKARTRFYAIVSLSDVSVPDVTTLQIRERR